jgi:phosphate transport system protein
MPEGHGADIDDTDAAAFWERLAELARMAEVAMSRATAAIVVGDVALAREVFSWEDALVALHRLLDEQALGVLARNQPAITDPRTIITGLRMSAELDRMGAMARHVAELAVRGRRRDALPPPLRPTVTAMGETARRLMVKVRAAMAERHRGPAPELDRDDDEMDRLVAALYRQLLHTDLGLDVATVLDLTLLGRYYEVFADHAVALAKRVAARTGIGV